MKTLTLLRHAKSSWKELGQRDFDRPLNKRGLEDISFMPQRLFEQVGKPDLVLSSLANRAQTTAKAFANFFKQPLQLEEGMYHTDPDRLMQFVASISDELNHVLVVAHNPGLTYLANRLGENFGIDNLPTCAYVTFNFEVDHWSEIAPREGKLASFDFPKNHH